jgi:hypothetical protein
MTKYRAKRVLRTRVKALRAEGNDAVANALEARLAAEPRGRIKRHPIIAALVAALVLSGSALGAWILYSGFSGSATGGSFSAAATQTAVVFSTAASPAATPVTPCTTGGTTGTCTTGGTPGTVQVQATVMDPAGATYSGVSWAFTTTPSTCASFLHWSPTVSAGAPTGASGAISTGVLMGTYVADSGVPTSCSNATVTITPSGTFTGN